MKNNQHSADQNHFLARLSHLAAFQGMPNWSYGRQIACSHSDKPEVEHRKNARYFGAIAKKIRSIRNRIAEQRQFRANIRELRSLDDRALRDIGLHRGDIAALASRAQPVAELTQLREELARPVCRVIELSPAKAVKKPLAQTQLFDNAA